MKSLRSFSCLPAALSLALLLSLASTAPAAPKKEAPAPAAEAQPAKKPSFFQRVKSKLTREPEAPAPAPAPAPRKAVPAKPAPAPQPEPEKKSFLQRVKSGFTRNDTPETEAPAPAKPQAKPATKAAPAPLAPPAEPEKPGFLRRMSNKLGLNGSDDVQETPPAAPQPAKPERAAKSFGPPAEETAPEPEKKSFLRRLTSPFSRDEAPMETPPESTQKPATQPLANAKTLPPGDAAPEKKGSFFSRMSNGIKQRLTGMDPGQAEVASVTAAKRERPKDWKEHSIVTDGGAAFYHYGPSQGGGPDEWLPRGTALKVLAIDGGWARVQLAAGQTGLIDKAQLRGAELADFSSPEAKKTPKTLLASLAGPDAWTPMPAQPDLPESGAGPDANGALLLLPPLEGELDPIRTLLPGDRITQIPANPEPPSLDGPAPPGDALPELPADPEDPNSLVLPEPPAPTEAPAAPASAPEVPAAPAPEPVKP